jgi:hypothetical protein
MSEGQSQRTVALSAQHRQEAEVAAAEEHERAAVETAATATRLAMAELAAARAEVEAPAAADAARAAAAELKALRASSTDISVSADDDRDNELKLAREAAWEQAAQWARRLCSGRGPNWRGRASGWVDGDRGLRGLNQRSTPTLRPRRPIHRLPRRLARPMVETAAPVATGTSTTTKTAIAVLRRQQRQEQQRRRWPWWLFWPNHQPHWFRQ